MQIFCKEEWKNFNLLARFSRNLDAGLVGNFSASLGRDVDADFARNSVALLAGNVMANVLVVVGALFAGDVLALLHIVANLVGHNLANLLRDIQTLLDRHEAGDQDGDVPTLLLWIQRALLQR